VGGGGFASLRSFPPLKKKPCFTIVAGSLAAAARGFACLLKQEERGASAFFFFPVSKDTNAIFTVSVGKPPSPLPGFARLTADCYHHGVSRQAACHLCRASPVRQPTAIITVSVGKPPATSAGLRPSDG